MVNHVIKHFVDSKTGQSIVVEATKKGWCFTLPDSYRCYRDNESSIKENLEEAITCLKKIRCVK